MTNLFFNNILRDDLNYAFSINYMVLENLNNLLPQNGQTVFSRDDIFRSKSTEERLYNIRFHQYAKMRNKYFLNIQKALDSFNFEARYKANTNTLINIYNETTGDNMNYDDVFGADDVKNWELYSKIYQSLNSQNFVRLDGRGKLMIALHHFGSFYENYKVWKVVSDIFEVLQNDINSYGSKTLYFGKPDNPNIIKVSKEQFDEIDSTCNKIINTLKRRTLNEERKISKKLRVSTDESDLDVAGRVLERLHAIMCLKKAQGDFETRFESANRKPVKKENDFKNLERELLFLKNNKKTFSIDNIYFHKIEIRDMIEPMSLFPEFDEIRARLLKVVFGNDQTNAAIFNSTDFVPSPNNTDNSSNEEGSNNSASNLENQ